MEEGVVDGDGAEVGGGGGSRREGSCSITYVMLALTIAALGVGVSYITLQGPKSLT